MLKNYYKDPEPWRHEPAPEPLWKQLSKILLALAVCSVIIYFALNYKGYDWSNFGFVQMLNDMMSGTYDYIKPPAR